MKLPKMREGQLGYVRVISVTRDGGFVDIGAERGVFLPYSQMRGHVSEGQLVWVKLYRDKSGRQAVTMRVEEDMQRASKPAEGLKVGEHLPWQPVRARTSSRISIPDHRPDAAGPAPAERG